MTKLLDAVGGLDAAKKALCHELHRRIGRMFHRNVVIAFEQWRNTGTLDYDVFVGELNEAHTPEILAYSTLLDDQECAIQGPEGPPGPEGEQGIQGEPGPEFLYWQAENMAEVNSTIGWFSRATINQSNPSGLATTQSSNTYQNGLLTPWLIPGDWQIYDLKVCVAAACVSTATVGTAPTFRLDLYQVNVANRSLITTVRLPCIANPTFINPNNSLTPASSLIYFAEDDFDPAIVPANSTLFGIEFVNESGSEDTINGFARATASIVLQRVT